MTYPVGDLALNDLLEAHKALQREIQTKVMAELSVLDTRRETLLCLLNPWKEQKFPSPAMSVSKAAPLAKYRDPDTGKSWTGKGKRPRWFDPQRADEFLIAPVTSFFNQDETDAAEESQQCLDSVVD